MTYAEFKSDHDYLVTELIFTSEKKKIDRLLDWLEKLRDNESKHYAKLLRDLS